MSFCSILYEQLNWHWPEQIIKHFSFKQMSCFINYEHFPSAYGNINSPNLQKVQNTIKQKQPNPIHRSTSLLLVHNSTKTQQQNTKSQHQHNPIRQFRKNINLYVKTAYSLIPQFILFIQFSNQFPIITAAITRIKYFYDTSKTQYAEQKFITTAMAQILITAGSTNLIDLNDEQLEFYQEMKNKQIQQVRSALAQLHTFSTLPKKDKIHVDLSPLWQALLVLAKILGFHHEFQTVKHLQIPETLLTQGLMTNEPFFYNRCYIKNSTVDSEQEKYYVLVQGVVERQPSKTSGLRPRESRSSARKDSIKLKKFNYRKIVRTEEQMPVCINFQRNEGKNTAAAERISLKMVTNATVFEVYAARWRRYVQEFQRLQGEYLMSFIRKKLTVNLNIDYVTEQPKPISSNNSAINKNGESEADKRGSKRGSRKYSRRESRRESRKSRESTVKLQAENQKAPATPNQNQKGEDQLFTIEPIKRKTVMQLRNSSLYLLFLGEMLINSPYYKIEVSRGCVLNSAIGNILSYPVKDQTEQDDRQPRNNSEKVTAHAKSDVLLIKISIKKLQTYFQTHEEDEYILKNMLINLELSRRTKTEQLNKLNQTSKSTNWGQTQRDGKQLNHLQLHPHNINRTTFTKIKKDPKEQAQPPHIRNEHRERIFQCDLIENRVNKTARAAELKQQQYLKKLQFTQQEETSLCNMPNYPNGLTDSLSRDRLIEHPLAYSLFKDSMGRIENKSQLLKELVRQNRKRKIAESMGIVPHQPHNSANPLTKKIPSYLCNSASVLRRKIKEIYIKTEQCENTVNLSILSERLPQFNCPPLEPTERIAPNVPFNQQINNLSSNSMLYSYSNWVKAGIMRKMPSGQIRRVKMR